MIFGRSEIRETGQDVVVFFDFENIVYSLRQSMGKNPNFEILMEKCQEYGRVVLARAYADWSRHNTVIAPLQASGFDPVYVPTYFYENHEKRTRKNAVDIHIAIEAIEVLFTQPHIKTFVLLTGDKDFIPLANALRRHGKTVIAVGVRGTTSPYMRQATDDFFFYHQLLDEPFDKKRKTSQGDIYVSLVEAVKKLDREGQKTVFPAVKHTLSEMLGSFNEKNYKDENGVPFSRFKDFILEAQRLGFVRLITTGSVNEVLLPEAIVGEFELVRQMVPEETAPIPEKQPDELPLPQSPETVTDLESAFELLVWAVNKAKVTGKSPRASSIKTIMCAAVQDFDEKQIPDQKFTKFMDFTQAAANQGLVEIKGKGIKMEIHPPAQEMNLDEEAEAEMDDEIPDHPPLANLQPIPTVPPDEGELVNLRPIEPETEFVSLEKPETYISEYRMRVVIIDALRSCLYPAPPHVIGRHCLNLSERRQVNLPNRRLNQLLTAARKMGILRRGEGEESNQFVFVENPDLIRRFLDGEE